MTMFRDYKSKKFKREVTLARYVIHLKSFNAYVFPLKFNLLTMVSRFPITWSLFMFLVSHPFLLFGVSSLLFFSLSITGFLQDILEVLSGFAFGMQISWPGTVFLPAYSFFSSLGKLHFPGLLMTMVNASALCPKKSWNKIYQTSMKCI